MKIFILVLLNLVAEVFAGVWIPSPSQFSPEGKTVFNLPYPKEMGGVGKREGFFLIPSGNPFNFKRILAISGPQPDSSLVEYSSSLYLPSQNPRGYILIEDSKKALDLNLKGASRNEPGFQIKRFAPTLLAVQQLPEIDQIPTKLEDFGRWAPGDSIAYTKNLDLLVNSAFAAKTFHNFGVTGYISSYWDIVIRLQENPEKKGLVFLSYSLPEGFSFRFNKGGFNEDVNLFKLWGRSQSFSYLFDLSNNKNAPPIKILRFEGNKQIESTVENANSLMAYQEALKGNLVLANLLSQMKNYGVRKIFEEEDENKNRDPLDVDSFIIPTETDPDFMKGNLYIVGKGKISQDNFLFENSSVHYSQNINHTQMGKVVKSRNFVGFIQQIENLGKTRGSSNRRFSASFKSALSIASINREEYLQLVKSSLFKIGFLDDSLIPGPLNDQVSNLKLNLEINLSNIALDVLMDLPGEYPENVMVSQANESVNEFFKNQGSANHELCENYGVIDLNRCIFISKKETFEAMTNGYRALKQMKIKRNERNYVEFLQSFGEFGKAFSENRFSLVTFLKFLSYHYRPSISGRDKFEENRVITVDGKPITAPFDIMVQINGENIRPYSKVLRSKFRDPNN